MTYSGLRLVIRKARGCGGDVTWWVNGEKMLNMVNCGGIMMVNCVVHGCIITVIFCF